MSLYVSNLWGDLKFIHFNDWMILHANPNQMILYPRGDMQNFLEQMAKSGTTMNIQQISTINGKHFQVNYNHESQLLSLNSPDSNGCFEEFVLNH